MKAWAGLRGAERSVREPAGYAAFISYSHAADGLLAAAVQRGLERLARPWYRRRALRVFRDDSGLAVTPALWSEIAAALDESEHLVVLASPEAAQSKWVGQEIEHWKATKRVERILLVVTEGECRWDAGRGGGVHPDGRMIASAGGGSTVRRWNAATGAPIGQPLTGHTDEVWGVAFSPGRQNHRLLQLGRHSPAVANHHRCLDPARLHAGQAQPDPRRVEPIRRPRQVVRAHVPRLAVQLRRSPECPTYRHLG
ncbi:MAG: TIR domain-containing protein [Egibacteraceae bacterium]